MTTDRDRSKAPPVSIVDIARSAGVSPSTVSRVFNKPALVQPETRQAILDVAEALGYRPNASARTLRTRRSQVLGIVLPTLDNPVFAECLQGMAGAAAHAGYALMPVTTQYRVASEDAAVDQLLAFGVDGMALVVSDAASSRAVRRLNERGMPYVLAYNRHDAHPCVSVAGSEAMHEVVAGLLELGHRRIAMVCGRLSASDRAEQRYAGFQEAMRLAGIAPSPLIEVPFVETAIREIGLVLEKPHRPTALVCSNDLIAVRAVRAAHESGLRVPADVSITGFDGIGLGHELTPSLSTVAQPNTDIGSAAVTWLVRCVGDQCRPAAADSITLPHVVRWAESSSRVPLEH